MSVQVVQYVSPTSSNETHLIVVDGVGMIGNVEREAEDYFVGFHEQVRLNTKTLEKVLEALKDKGMV